MVYDEGMRYHHTKNKGDLGVRFATFDLTEKGFDVLLPLTEHAPFDLVAYDRQRFFRVSVKYRAAPEGIITVNFRSIWADRHGVHVVPLDKNEVDVFAIYCPDTRLCYYLDPKEFRSSVVLRVTPAKNNNSKLVHLASDYLEFPKCGSSEHRRSASQQR